MPNGRVIHHPLVVQRSGDKHKHKRKHYNPNERQRQHQYRRQRQLHHSHSLDNEQQHSLNPHHHGQLIVKFVEQLGFFVYEGTLLSRRPWSLPTLIG